MKLLLALVNWKMLHCPLTQSCHVFANRHVRQKVSYFILVILNRRQRLSLYCKFPAFHCLKELLENIIETFSKSMQQVLSIIW